MRLKTPVAPAPQRRAALIWQGYTYPLQPGINVVGRKAESSKAAVQLDDPTRRMSREHLIININITVAGVLEATIQPAKDGVCLTTIDNKPLGSTPVIITGDAIVRIHSGAQPIEFTIKL